MGNIKTHQGESQKFTNDPIFSPVWTNWCKTVGEVKDPNAFHRGVNLRVRFAPGNSPGGFSWDTETWYTFVMIVKALSQTFFLNVLAINISTSFHRRNFHHTQYLDDIEKPNWFHIFEGLGNLATMFCVNL